MNSAKFRVKWLLKNRLYSIWTCFLVIGVLSISSFSTSIYAQDAETRFIQILQAEISKRSITADTIQSRQLVGNVEIRDGNTLIACDSAVQYLEQGRIEAFGNISIKSERRTVYADRMNYDLKSDKSTFMGRVILLQDSTFIQTTYMVYEDEIKKASFPRLFLFIEKDDWLLADAGMYFREADSAVVAGNVHSAGKDGFISADSLILSRKNQRFKAMGNSFFEDSDGLNKINADTLIADSSGYRESIGNVFVQRIDSTEMDTSALFADIIFIQPDSIRSDKDVVSAYGKVSQWSDDLSARSDTLVFNEAQDFIYWKTNKPTIWQQDSELKADSIHLELRNQKAYRLNAVQNAIHISQDSVSGRFNQIAAQSIRILFDEDGDKPKSMTAKPAAKAIYQSKDEQDQSDGLIRITGESLVAYFDSTGSLEEVKSFEKIQGSYYEESEELAKLKLDGFSWIPDQKPKKPEIWPQDKQPIPEKWPLFKIPKRNEIPEVYYKKREQLDKLLLEKEKRARQLE